MQRRAQRSVSGCEPAVPAGDDPYELWRTPAWVVAMAREDLARAWGVLTVLRGLDPGLAAEVAGRYATDLHARFGR